MNKFRDLLLIIAVIVIFSCCQKQPKAVFTVSKTTADIEEIITFTNNSSDADNFKWEFGDGQTSIDENTFHFYSTSVTYTENLTTYSKNGNKENVKITTIAIEENEKGTYTDSRDGKIYNTVKIGNQWWMVENLAYKTDTGCWAYDNDESHVSTYGYLYDWETAKKVCPSGWKLPSKSDFDTLLNNFGHEGKVAYKALIPSGNSVFSALFGGCRYDNGNFYGRGHYAHFWSASQYGNNYAWFFYMYGNHKTADMGNYHKSYGFSVRCLQDN